MHTHTYTYTHRVYVTVCSVVYVLCLFLVCVFVSLSLTLCSFVNHGVNELENCYIMKIEIILLFFFFSVPLYLIKLLVALPQNIPDSETIAALHEPRREVPCLQLSTSDD